MRTMQITNRYKKKHKTITKGQRRAIQEHWDTYGVDLKFNHVLDLDSFAHAPHSRPHTILNIGNVEC